MKKIFLSLILLLLAVPIKGNCADEGRFLYTIVSGRAIITGYEGEPEFLEIPQVIDNCTVTETANDAFYGCRSLKRLILPPTMRKIGDRSFYACYSLEQVILPDGLEKIGESGFCGCTELKHIFIPDSLVEIPESCFRACLSLTEVNIPANIKRIGNYAFSGCTGLERVTLGDELSEIGERAFFMCGRLNRMYIPSSVTRLSDEAVGYVPSNNGAAPMSGFELSGKKGSEAQRYAEECGITFRKSNDIIRHSSAYHPSEKSQKTSEICVLSAFVLFLTTAGASVISKNAIKRKN